jgi:hypothetical protein
MSETVAKRFTGILVLAASYLHRRSVDSQVQGRLLALPVGAALMVALPIARLLIFGEALFTVSGVGSAAVGVLLSPFVALFAGAAAALSMLQNPIKATARFADACRAHPTNKRKSCPKKPSP